MHWSDWMEEGLNSYSSQVCYAKSSRIVYVLKLGSSVYILVEALGFVSCSL